MFDPRRVAACMPAAGSIVSCKTGGGVEAKKKNISALGVGHKKHVISPSCHLDQVCRGGKALHSSCLAPPGPRALELSPMSYARNPQAVQPLILGR